MSVEVEKKSELNDEKTFKKKNERKNGANKVTFFEIVF